MPDSLFDHGELEHLRWLSVYGGGDELADANCWNDTKRFLGPLLDVAQEAEKWITSGRDADHPVRTLGEVAEAIKAALARLEEATRA